MVVVLENGALEMVEVVFDIVKAGAHVVVEDGVKNEKLAVVLSFLEHIFQLLFQEINQKLQHILTTLLINLQIIILLPCNPLLVPPTHYCFIFL